MYEIYLMYTKRMKIKLINILILLLYHFIIFWSSYKL